MRGRQYHGIEIRHREADIKERTGSHLDEICEAARKLKTSVFRFFLTKTRCGSCCPKVLEGGKNNEQLSKNLRFEISSLNKSDRHRISALIWAKEPSRNPSWSSPALCRRSRLRSLDSESFRAIRGPKDHPSRLDLVHRKLSHRSSWHPDQVCGLGIAAD